MINTDIIAFILRELQILRHFKKQNKVFGIGDDVGELQLQITVFSFEVHILDVSVLHCAFQGFIVHDQFRNL